ncbi:ras association domain-containing protein 10 isoform X2 [Eupeodes corollae]|uniref:ras association domain-containing protein 10 isoform X2 n=1 Tax=Eupeodes corollae TaxID=290404 RepID=UPI002491A7AD|nr:ras association domain-containing protein 10 isoform X2 [Eupeodes corollae]
MAPHNSTLIDENLGGFPSSLDLRHYSPILRPETDLTRHNRAISIHGSISTLEQGNKEIPIWVENKPRYVAGVTSRTTCNDIIKALIDDEVKNGNYAYNNRRDGVVESRDYSDYVITECWRGVERSYEGNMTILPVWKAWSRVHNEIRLSLKRQSEVATLSDKKTISRRALTSIRKYINKLLKLLTRKKKPSDKNTKPRTSSNDNKSTKNCHDDDDNKNESQVDELIFVILPDKQYNNQTITKTNEERRLKEKLYQLSEQPKKKRRNSASSSSSKRQRTPMKIGKQIDHHNRRRRDMPIRSLLRNQIAQKTSEVDQLFSIESHLMKELSNKCRQFRQQNEMYTKEDHQLEISIGQIQNSIEQYAEEILKTERELLEIKNEIKHDISIINNLKRMTFEKQKDVVVNRRTPSTWNAPKIKDVPENLNDKNMQFVDNIYEFCDNNESMLV